MDFFSVSNKNILEISENTNKHINKDNSARYPMHLRCKKYKYHFIYEIYNVANKENIS